MGRAWTTVAWGKHAALVVVAIVVVKGCGKAMIGELSVGTFWRVSKRILSYKKYRAVYRCLRCCTKESQLSHNKFSALLLAIELPIFSGADTHSV